MGVALLSASFWETSFRTLKYQFPSSWFNSSSLWLRFVAICRMYLTGLFAFMWNLMIAHGEKWYEYCLIQEKLNHYDFPEKYNIFMDYLLIANVIEFSIRLSKDPKWFDFNKVCAKNHKQQSEYLVTHSIHGSQLARKAIFVLVFNMPPNIHSWKTLSSWK